MTYELIVIDNSKEYFGSAAEALNPGGAKAKGEYIMFVHQDVQLCSNTWLEDAEKLLSDFSDLGLAGVAGMRDNKISKIFKAGNCPEENMSGFIYCGNDKKPWGYLMSGPMEVQTLDELLMIIPARVYANLKYDEITCKGWHLYGIDYALSIRNMGVKAYVLPLPVWHMSYGALNEDYFRVLRSIIAKHDKE